MLEISYYVRDFLLYRAEKYLQKFDNIIYGWYNIKSILEFRVFIKNRIIVVIRFFLFMEEFTVKKLLVQMGLIIVSLLVLVLLAFTAFHSKHYIIGVLFTAFEIICIFSIRTYKADEMAIVTIFKTPIYMVSGGGVCLVPFGSLIKLPMARFDIVYEMVKVTAIAGDYIPQTNGASSVDIKPVSYPEGTMEVEVTGYAQLPQEFERLLKFIRAGIKPTSDGLKSFTSPIISAAIYSAFSNQNMGQIMHNRTAEGGAIDSMNKFLFSKEDGPLVKAGFTEKDVGIFKAEVKLPALMEKAMTELQAAMYDEQTATNKAHIEFLEDFGPLLAAAAVAKGKSLEDFLKSDNTDLTESLLDYVKKFNRQKELAKIGGYFELNMKGDGSSGLGGTIAEAITLFKKFSSESPKPSASKKSEKEKGTSDQETTQGENKPLPPKLTAEEKKEAQEKKKASFVQDEKEQKEWEEKQGKKKKK